jgi:hypothetical protein
VAATTILASTLVFSHLKLRWKEKYQIAFHHIKKILKETLISYPNISKSYEIYTVERKFQIGNCISQESKAVAFYRRKLNSLETPYITKKIELLSFAEALK